MNIAKMINKFKIYRLKRRGLKIGNNFSIESRVRIDKGLPWAIEIGDNVTLAPEVMILSHDAATKKIGGFISVGRVKIGNNVFVGARTIILSNVTIGDNCIIGAGSIVTKDIPSNSIACGNPARAIKTMEAFLEEKKLSYGKGDILEEKILKVAINNKEVQEELKEKMRSGRLLLGKKNE